MKTLLIPALVWCVSTAGFAATRTLALPVNLAPVCITVAEEPPQKEVGNRAGDRLDGLREQLGGLQDRLEKTHKAVEDIARQRDEARRQAEQSAAAKKVALEEAAALRKELAQVRKESAQWKSKAVALDKKVQAGVLAQRDLEKFRGDLQGAMASFAAMKEDFGQAREILEDPKERLALRKEAAKLKEERQRLGSEIEVALQAKKEEQAKARKMRGELEDKLKRVMSELMGAKNELAGMAKLKAAHEGAMADVKALKGELVRVSEKQAKMKSEAEAAGRKWAAEVKEGKEQVAVLQTTVKSMKAEVEAFTATTNALTQELQRAKKAASTADQQVAAAEEKIKAMEQEAKKPHEALMRSEESRRKAMEQVKEAKEVTSKIKTELAETKRAKVGLEELLFKKTDEVRGLKKRLRELEAAAKRGAEAQAEGRVEATQ
jgi:chromosome segregation ATPase